MWTKPRIKVVTQNKNLIPPQFFRKFNMLQMFCSHFLNNLFSFPFQIHFPQSTLFGLFSITLISVFLNLYPLKILKSNKLQLHLKIQWMSFACENRTNVICMWKFNRWITYITFKIQHIAFLFRLRSLSEFPENMKICLLL